MHLIHVDNIYMLVSKQQENPLKIHIIQRIWTEACNEMIAIYRNQSHIKGGLQPGPHCFEFWKIINWKNDKFEFKNHVQRTDVTEIQRLNLRMDKCVTSKIQNTSLTDNCKWRQQREN